MYVVDETVWKDEAIDSYIRRCLTALRVVQGLQGPDGCACFGFDMQDGTYMVIEPVETIFSSAKDSVWIGGRVDSEGRGFRIDSPVSFHEAFVQSLQMPSPVYALDDVPFVINQTVKSAKHAQAVLEDALTHEDAPAPAFA